MSKQYSVNLSDRQIFDAYLFLRATVQPKDRKEGRSLKGVYETFGMIALRDKLEELGEGGTIKRTEFSAEPHAIECGSVDLNQLLEYLDKPGASADGALIILDISDELLRAKEGRSLQSVPDEKGA